MSQLSLHPSTRGEPLSQLFMKQSELLVHPLQLLVGEFFEVDHFLTSCHVSEK